jgi:hypothetical protein
MKAQVNQARLQNTSAPVHCTQQQFPACQT